MFFQQQDEYGNAKFQNKYSDLNWCNSFQIIQVEHKANSHILIAFGLPRSLKTPSTKALTQKHKNSFLSIAFHTRLFILSTSRAPLELSIFICSL
jgi:hypothetical protein